jgi:NAD(P)-dependent dehydrogenase (short-subunit alcohol dehydrogenase family)
MAGFWNPAGSKAKRQVNGCEHHFGHPQAARSSQHSPQQAECIRWRSTWSDRTARIGWSRRPVATYGGVDVLVNNIGAVRPRLDGFLALTDADWEWALGINLMPAVRATRAALPHLLQRAPSTIVTISSVNAFLPDPGVIDYSAAKGALTNFCKSLSKEFGPRGVRVNTISPGPVETALWLGKDGVAATVANAGNGDAAEVAKQQAAAAATGRFTRPDEVADLVALLAGGRAGNTTGSDIVIDGGLITTL